VSAVYNAVLHMTDPEIPANTGRYRPIEVIAPPGTVVNANFPASTVGGNSEVHPHLVTLIWKAMAAAVPDSDGCVIVPAFSGLFAPRWRSDARGVICGLTRFHTKAHIARAALDATAYATRELVEAMVADAGVALPVLRVDGGMTANDLLLQIQADVLGLPVVRPSVIETTALGAAYAAGLAVGFWSSLEELRAIERGEREWAPHATEQERERGYATWNAAVERSLGWA
jgi:glycerol kinase